MDLRSQLSIQARDVRSFADAAKRRETPANPADSRELGSSASSLRPSGRAALLEVAGWRFKHAFKDWLAAVEELNSSFQNKDIPTNPFFGNLV